MCVFITILSLDALAAEVSMKKQTSGRYRALTYQLEREVRGSPAPLFQPTRPLLESLLARGREERAALLPGDGTGAAQQDDTELERTGMRHN
jgi:hypothetical protein